MFIDRLEDENQAWDQDQHYPGAVTEFGHRKYHHDEGGTNGAKAIDEHFHVQDGETSEDGELSVLTARCLGACGLAPAVILDGETIPKAAPAEIVPIVEGAIKNGS